MKEIQEHYSHSIYIDKDLCNGCVVCTLACPVNAIRVIDGKAEVIKDKLCIDCGECLRVCPVQAVKSMTSKSQDLTGYRVLAAVPSPVLFAQFGSHYTPNDILLALQKIGFDYIYDVGLSCEMVLMAIDEYLRRNQEIRPMISNFCPAVTRMIFKSYPDLIEHIIPIEIPREIGALQIRKKIVEEKEVNPEEVGVFHITPCAAKMISITNPVGVERSNLDGAIGIRDLYGPLVSALKEVDDDWIIQKSSGVGMSWAIGKASLRGLTKWSTLSVTGVKDVIDILDTVEKGKLKNVDYLECSICPGGCVGGPLVVQNKHLAASRIENLVEQYGVKSRVDSRKVLRNYESLYLLKEIRANAPSPDPLDPDLKRALEMMNRIEEIRELLPGKQCGACGAPTCQSLAEDIVKGEASLTDCVFIRIKELTNAVKRTGAKAESGNNQ
ncbi:4Fe-4S dicluster domain-containing protein [bacterium]|nr:4Fe-4S dicluster domain-containing protein [candidate division CSSED10-310 bacterium]